LEINNNNFMSEKYIVYHNPRCSKSRMAINYLNENNKSFEVKEYLKVPLKRNDLIKVLRTIGRSAESIIRKNEKDYKENFKGKKLDEDQWIDAMIKFPKLMQRPIVIKANKGIVARPAELIDTLD
tara:strand:+ start:68697 stop:69071 length:375 start_codon:yes stop_codon:yes gene_type:complete